jgi:class 3 adenylate cyclase/tetratricopeptide (TPR) repeat protein
VICPNCATENKPGRRFCVRCATPLQLACPNCGAAYDPGDAFCGECATPLGDAVRPPVAHAQGVAQPIPASGSYPSPISGAGSGAAPGAVAERRLVSVLFADLVGFTPFAEERDAEDVRDTLTRYFDIASDVIGRYGGTIEKFIGDAVMAVWGTPTAREDDAERSVRAALDLVDAVRSLGPSIQARAGVLTGEAAVTLGATNQGMVAGDVVNTAARLQSAAQPGTVLVAESTMRAASAAIAFEPAGEQTLKGKVAPVPAYRALRVVAQRRGSGRSDLPEPPFVGRDEELRLLKDLIGSTGRDRRTRLVSISGPGGIGKSRLAWELEKYIDGISETIYWHRGRSPAYGEGITFWALGEMVRRRAGLAETDDEATTRERIKAVVDRFVSGQEDRAWVEPALLTLLGLEPAPAGGRDVLFAAWRIFFERIAEQATTVLLFEDLQWADTGLLDFIEQVLEWSKNVPLIVVTLARPELFDRRPDWGAETRNLTRLALEPLTDDAMRGLIASFVPGLPAAAVDAILARADGMPLYAVETVRSLVADGRLERDGDAYRPVGELGTLAVPDTLRSLIASRLDSLEPADHSLVADASVLGQSFTMAGLSAISGHGSDVLEPRLKVLVRRELFDLEIDPRSPERGQYRFVQSLIREVAYGTLAKRERRARHLAAARYFEGLGDDELAGLLASHYVAAIDASAEGAEADAVAIQARLALSGAAERAATLGAHDQAVSYLRQAISIATEPAERTDLHFRAARSANAAARYADAEGFARAGVELAREGGDGAAAGAGEALLGEITIDAGQPSEAVAILEAAAASFPESGSAEVRAAILANLSRALMRAEELPRSIVAADEALDLAEHLGLERLVADSFNNKGSSLGYLGRRREGTALLRAAVEIAHAGGFVAAELRAMNNLATGLDDLGEARDLYRAAEELGARVGNRSMTAWARESRRFYDFNAAIDWDAAMVGAGDADTGAESSLDEIRRLFNTLNILIARGQPTDAALARLETLSAQVSDPFALASLHGLRGDRAMLAAEFSTAVDEAFAAAAAMVSFAPATLSAAIRAAVRGGDLVRAREAHERIEADPGIGAIVDAGRAAARAGVAELEGRVEDAIAGYRDAIARFRAIGFNVLAGRSALDLVRLVGGRHPAGAEAAAEARTIFERVGAKPYLELLETAEAGPGVAPRPMATRDASAPRGARP